MFFSWWTQQHQDVCEIPDGNLVKSSDSSKVTRVRTLVSSQVFTENLKSSWCSEPGWRLEVLREQSWSLVLSGLEVDHSRTHICESSRRSFQSSTGRSGGFHNGASKLQCGLMKLRLDNSYMIEAPCLRTSSSLENVCSTVCSVKACKIRTLVCWDFRQCLVTFY